MRLSKRMARVVVGCAVAFGLWGCGGSSTETPLPTSSPERGIYAGTIVDSTGSPVAGAVVSVEGVEARAVTGADGTYYIEDEALVPETSEAMTLDVVMSAPAKSEPEPVEVSVLAPGYEPTAVTKSVAEGDRANVRLAPVPDTLRLVVSSPTGTRTFVVPAGCESPKVVVEGYASLTPSSSLRMDVVIAVDRSGSTKRLAFDFDDDGDSESVLEVEVAAASRFLEKLDPSITRAALVSFEDSAQIVSGFTSDLDSVVAALQTVQVPVHGTNYEAAFMAARELFSDLDARDAVEEVPAEDPPVEVPPPLRVVVFLSDGIPTSHGIPRDRSDSNLTQSKDDRRAALDAAEALGTLDVRLSGFSIISEEDSNRRRTTLPHCIAKCGGGHYVNVNQPQHLVNTLCGEPLDESLTVEIVNETLKMKALEADLFPDGFFSERVPVSAAPSPKSGSSTWTNTLRVTMRARVGKGFETVTRRIDVQLISEEQLGLLDETELLAVQTAPRSVLELSYLERPTGGLLGDPGLLEFLKSDFEDALELYGVETFVLRSAAEGGPSSLRLDFVYKEACYRSDVGYLFLDPADPPSSAQEALAAVDPSQILFNSGDVGGSVCSLQSIEPGGMSRSIPNDAGGVLAFFLIPNRTLDEYWRNPEGGPAPLFTLSGLNPGGFDQVLTFRSEVGRTAEGSSREVVSPGPLVIFAFEDLSVAKQSDQDFTDVVFTVTAVQGRLDALECD